MGLRCFCCGWCWTESWSKSGRNLPLKNAGLKRPDEAEMTSLFRLLQREGEWRSTGSWKIGNFVLTWAWPFSSSPLSLSALGISLQRWSLIWEERVESETAAGLGLVWSEGILQIVSEELLLEWGRATEKQRRRRRGAGFDTDIIIHSQKPMYVQDKPREHCVRVLSTHAQPWHSNPFSSITDAS